MVKVLLLFCPLSGRRINLSPYNVTTAQATFSKMMRIHRAEAEAGYAGQTHRVWFVSSYLSVSCLVEKVMSSVHFNLLLTV